MSYHIKDPVLFYYNFCAKRHTIADGLTRCYFQGNSTHVVKVEGVVSPPQGDAKISLILLV